MTEQPSIIEFLLARIDTDFGEALFGSDTLANERRLIAVKAKRAIIAEHRPFDDPEGILATDDLYCRMCVSPNGFPVRKRATVGVPFPCRTLRLLALHYADHPDYRAEWRPES